MTPKTSEIPRVAGVSSRAPIGFLEVLIGYANVDGQTKPIMANIIGKDDSLEECRDKGQHAVLSVLEGQVPDGARAIVACVPIPPATQAIAAPERRRYDNGTANENQTGNDGSQKL